MKKVSRGGDQQYNEPSSRLFNNAFMFINQSLPTTYQNVNKECRNIQKEITKCICGKIRMVPKIAFQ